jgi:antitoxin (DNA-binding transcriptional repressor) of toxin-antitoxin stability system
MRVRLAERWRVLESNLVWSDQVCYLLSMRVNTISEAKAQLSSLVERALSGEEVIIARAGRPVVKLVRHTPGAEGRKPGTLRGKITMTKDFDEWPADVARALGMLEE